MPEPRGLTPAQHRRKRALDLVLGGLALVVTGPIALAGIAMARRDTGLPGVFSQERIGRDGVPFRVYKVRTMRSSAPSTSTVTVDADPRVTHLGAVLRRFKIDELPQLFNVVRGEMSLVGPRPDVVGWADQLQGADRVVLSVAPGLTGPATLAYRHEERLLAAADDPEAYNRDVVWPDKVRANREYVENWSLAGDLRLLWLTVVSVFDRGDDRKGGERAIFSR